MHGNTIETPGGFVGRFVLVDLATGRVLTNVPVDVGTSMYVMTSGPRETALRNDLAENVRRVVQKACPKMLLDGGP
jgi:hypothetical protein